MVRVDQPVLVVGQRDVVDVGRRDDGMPDQVLAEDRRQEVTGDDAVGLLARGDPEHRREKRDPMRPRKSRHDFARIGPCKAPLKGQRVFAARDFAGVGRARTGGH
jgi:hypothetical protein